MVHDDSKSDSISFFDTAGPLIDYPMKHFTITIISYLPV